MANAKNRHLRPRLIHPPKCLRPGPYRHAKEGLFNIWQIIWICQPIDPDYSGVPEASVRNFRQGWKTWRSWKRIRDVCFYKKDSWRTGLNQLKPVNGFFSFIINVHKSSTHLQGPRMHGYIGIFRYEFWQHCYWKRFLYGTSPRNNWALPHFVTRRNYGTQFSVVHNKTGWFQYKLYYGIYFVTVSEPIGKTLISGYM